MNHDAWQAGLIIITAQFVVTEICLLLAAFTLHFRRRATVRIEIIELEAWNGKRSLGYPAGNRNIAGRVVRVLPGK